MLCQSTYPIYFDRNIVFLNPHTLSFLRHAQSRIDLCIARNFEFERNNLYLQKSQRHGQIHQGNFIQSSVESSRPPMLK